MRERRVRGDAPFGIRAALMSRSVCRVRFMSPPAPLFFLAVPAAIRPAARQNADADAHFEYVERLPRFCRRTCCRHVLTAFAPM